MFKKGVCITILLLAVAGSSAFGEAYFVDVNGGNWADPATWSGSPNDVNDITAYIGAPPNSPSGAWATLDSDVNNIADLIIGSSGSGRLDIKAGADLTLTHEWITAVGDSNSEATVYVTGGVVDGIGDMGTLPGQWAVDGTMNYIQTDGYVSTRLNHCAINPGSVVNIRVTGGVLNILGPGMAAADDVNNVPTPLNGQLNIEIDDYGWVLLRVVDLGSDTHITINGRGKLTVLGLIYDPTLGGIVSSRGTLKTRQGMYVFWDTVIF
ncbi:MAG: hypothetical protein GWP06_17060, partial [Actinobacteria bacterium]|nr:hypothetical protein [Actinomycetota bacterium]